jgi:hypothetical protein
LWRPSAWSRVGIVRGRVLRLEHDRARAVAEQHAGGAILPVEQPAEGLGADHQRAAVRAGADHAVRHLHRVEEARADRGDIERDAIVDSQHRLHLGGGGGEGVVGRGGGQHDQVDVLRRDAGGRDRGDRGVARQRRGGLALARDMAEADPGPLDDPLVGRVDPLGQFGVGDAACGESGTRPRQHGTDHAAALASK